MTSCCTACAFRTSANRLPDVIKRKKWTRRGAVVAVAAFAGVASHQHKEVTLVAILLVAIATAIVIISENA